MPLLAVARAAAIDADKNAVSFAMKDGCKLVTVHVLLSALRGDAFDLSPEECLDRFKRERRKFERIAQKKHAKKLVGDDDSLTIHHADVITSGSEPKPLEVAAEAAWPEFLAQRRARRGDM